MSQELAPSDWPGLALEAVEPAVIGVDVSNATVPPLMVWCLTALREIAPDSRKARLVVTGDFVGSVQSRLEGTDRRSYDLTRGSGFVGGKTMPRADGTVDVLVHAGPFAQRGDEVLPDGLDQLIKRTVVHEAQHVAMEQNEQGFRPLQGAGFRTINLTSAAASVIDEYRAELGVPASLRDGDLRWDGTEVTTALRSDLARVVADYQEHLDVGRLVYGVGTVALIAWRSLAYMAAWSRLVPDDDCVTADTLSHPLWQRMVARQWNRFVLCLETIPPGTTVMSRSEIDVAVVGLSEILNAWLLDLGFLWTEADDGNSLFRIVEWDLLDPDFFQPTTRTDTDG